jgi:hypothetical protein
MGGFEKLLWEYQQHFMINLKTRASSAFELLESDLEPEVVQYAFTKTSEEQLVSYLWPGESSSGIELFSDIFDRADAIQRRLREDQHEMLYGLPEAQKWHESRQRRSALRDAAQEIVDAQGQSTGRQAICSDPVELFDFWVITMLDFDAEQLSAHTALTKKVHWLHPGRSVVLSRSLVEALAFELLVECNRALLTVKDRDTYASLNLEPSELACRAGKRLLDTALRSADYDYGSDGVYVALDSVAASVYEGGAPKGHLILAKRDHPDVERLVTLRREISLDRSGRGARKLLETASDDCAMLAAPPLDQDYWLSVYGLGRVGSTYDLSTESVFHVRFIDRHRWSLAHGSRDLMLVKSGLPSLPKPPFSRSMLGRLLGQIFGGIQRKATEEICDLACQATEQRHGTMIVISSHAEAEAERLANQSTPVVEAKLTGGLLRQLSSIDGAMLLDTEARCHAIGVILDGMATDKGDSSRGARFNSAVRYCENRKEYGQSALAIVVSEDGYVDLVPDLPPRVRRSRLESLLARLAGLAASRKPDRVQYNHLMNEITSLRFYFGEVQCNAINDLVAQVEETLNKTDPVQIHILHPTLTPHPDMDDSYLTDDDQSEHHAPDVGSEFS